MPGPENAEASDYLDASAQQAATASEGAEAKK